MTHAGLSFYFTTTRSIILWAILVVAALLAGCSRTSPLVEGPAHPAMWEAIKGDTRLILIGSVHTLPPELDWHDLRVKRAINQADELVLELAPGESGKASGLFARMSRDQQVPSLAQRIGTDNADTLQDDLRGQGILGDDADTTESWALSLILSNMTAAAAGLTADNGVETVLTRLFVKDGKPVTGLESAQAQLTIFNNIAQQRQNEMLSRAIAEQARNREKIALLLRDWAAGDVTAIARYTADELARTPELVEPLVHARNRLWADTLTQRAGPRQTILVAVGTGHLVGPDALPDLLSEKGFVVRRLMP